tara:strand:+ start:1143 stop:1841 length:699 start_codon:yes stop_codon:yes gene_type:complete
MATGSPNSNTIFNKLKNVAGFGDLTRNQMKTKVASLAQKSVRNALKKAGYAGFALNEAIDVVIGASKVKGKADVKAEVQRRADRAAKKPDELQTEPMNSSKGRALGSATKSKTERKGNNMTVPKAKKKLVAMKDQGKGGKPGDGSTAVKKSLRPKARPFKDGGMPMVMKDGKKVPAYAADGVGKMNKGGMAKKKPAAKKMMAGGMAKKKMMGGGMAKTGYMYGGMAKKKAKK